MKVTHRKVELLVVVLLEVRALPELVPALVLAGQREDLRGGQEAVETRHAQRRTKHAVWEYARQAGTHLRLISIGGLVLELEVALESHRVVELEVPQRPLPLEHVVAREVALEHATEEGVLLALPHQLLGIVLHVQRRLLVSSARPWSIHGLLAREALPARKAVAAREALFSVGATLPLPRIITAGIGGGPARVVIAAVQLLLLQVLRPRLTHDKQAAWRSFSQYRVDPRLPVARGRLIASCGLKMDLPCGRRLGPRHS